MALLLAVFPLCFVFLLLDLLSDIVGSRIPAPNGRYLYDRERWNKEIQKLCFDSITDAINQVQ